MPYTEAKKMRGKFRLVERETCIIAKTKHGVARDGGGHASKAKAARQAYYVNQGIRRMNET